ncbi:FAD-dependent monooxygenase [Streptomyces sp. NPDC049887]|uniref:FAD-dependent monooxygenase n=1 Tax=Streptomyces sp. NPDC049887 TaxID=3155654 RepID=UPI003435151E
MTSDSALGFTDLVPPRHAEVAIVGAGPTGLTLAAELALRGTEAVVLEQLSARQPTSRSLVLHARTLEYLDMRGLAESAVLAGHRFSTYPLGSARSSVRLSGLPTRFPFALSLPQNRTEAMLERHASVLGARVIRRARVIALSSDAEQVRLTLDVNGLRREMTCSWLVGCDGSHSTVRRAAEIAFPCRRYPDWVISADVELRTPLSEPWSRFSADGMVIALPWGDSRGRFIIYDYRNPGSVHELTEEGLRKTLLRTAGRDFGVRKSLSMSRYRCEQGHAATYRQGRVLLAGDAAHVHPPTGGQGLNTGVADALNLGWKLSTAIADTEAEHLLDSYNAERSRAVSRILRWTDALLKFNTMSTVLGRAARRGLLFAAPLPFLQRRMAMTLSGLDVTYRTQEDAGPVGDRVPDIPVFFAGRPQRLYEVLRRGRPVHLSRSPANRPMHGAVHAFPLLAAEQLLLYGDILVRPDGYIADLSASRQLGRCDAQ